MTDTLANIKLTANTWSDIYSLTAIPVGTKIIIQNIGACDVSVATQLEQPSNEAAKQIIGRGDWVINDAGDSGAWAFCQSNGALINVRVA